MKEDAGRFSILRREIGPGKGSHIAVHPPSIAITWPVT